MRLKGGHAFIVPEIYMNFNIKLISTHYSILKKHLKTQEKKECGGKIFTACIHLILLDIIKNRVIFVLPTKRNAYIQMGVIQGEKFKELYKRGKFNDIDFMESNFTGNQLEYRWNGKIGQKRKNIYIGNKYKDLITEQTNNNEVLTSYIMKNTRDYLEELSLLFPIIDPEELYKTVVYGLKVFSNYISYGGDILIKGNGYPLVYFGNLYYNINIFERYRMLKYGIRCRVLFKKRKIEWDGYYYFGLSDSMMKFYESQEDSETKIFENIMVYKLLDELKGRTFEKNIFRCKDENLKKFRYYFELYESKNVELICQNK